MSLDLDNLTVVVKSFSDTAALQTDRESFKSATRNLGGNPHSEIAYTLLPKKINPKVPFTKLAFWRIELHDLGRATSPQGIDVLDDIIIGRGADTDIDLSPHIAETHGVSRKHIMLRPAPGGLYLIDLNSTNGTKIDGLPLRSNETRALDQINVVTLGSYSFTVKVISQISIVEQSHEEQSSSTSPEDEAFQEQTYRMTHEQISRDPLADVYLAMRTIYEQKYNRPSAGE